jgi:hypothetical protein
MVMERKDEQKQPDMEKPAQAQERDQRKPDEERDNTVGKVPDPQGEDEQRDRNKP